MSRKEMIITDEAGKQIRIHTLLDGFILAMPNASGGETRAFLTPQHAALLELFLRRNLEDR